MAMKPAFITKRMFIMPLSDHVDSLYDKFVRSGVWDPNNEKTGEFRDWLYEEIKSIAWHLQSALAKGAERGMEEVLGTISDPDYEKLKRQQQREDRERQKQKFELERIERERKELEGPTAEEKLALLNSAKRTLEYHRQRFYDAKAEIDRLENEGLPGLKLVKASGEEPIM